MFLPIPTLSQSITVCKEENNNNKLNCLFHKKCISIWNCINHSFRLKWKSALFLDSQNDCGSRPVMLTFKVKSSTLYIMTKNK